VTSRAAGTALDGKGAEVAIDFSIGSAVPETLSGLAAQRIDVVIGTTGWQAHEGACRQIADQAGIGVTRVGEFRHRPAHLSSRGEGGRGAICGAA